MAAHNNTYSSINTGYNTELTSANCPDTRVIIQEKVDGSQLSIYNKGGDLIFLNKKRQISSQSKPPM